MIQGPRIIRSQLQGKSICISFAVKRLRFSSFWAEPIQANSTQATLKLRVALSWSTATSSKCKPEPIHCGSLTPPY